MVKLKGKNFELLLSEVEIHERIATLAKAIENAYASQELTLVGVLNGSFRFLAALVDKLDMRLRVNFIRIASYKGVQQGALKQILGIEEQEISGRNVLIVEDIIDTGHTLRFVKETLQNLQPLSLSTATLLHKPQATEIPTTLEFVGFEIDNRFVVGYGLDYEGYGRELNGIYVLKNDKKPN